MILLALLLTASAQSPASLEAWSFTAMELRPDAAGDLTARGVERVFFEGGPDERFRVHIDGAVRLQPSPHQTWEGDVYRLALTHRGKHHTLKGGRFTRMDVRGFQSLDGISIDVEEGAMAGTVYAGRPWHPMAKDPDESWVAGFQTRLRPKDGHGGLSNMWLMTAGFEGAGGDDAPSASRVYLNGSYRGPRGASAMAFGEVHVVDGQSDWRAEIRGSGPMGRSVDFGGDLRWEGVDPDDTPNGVRTPMSWLAPQGYALASADLRMRQERWTIAFRGGGTLVPGKVETAEGAFFRADATHAGRTARVGLFATAAGIESTWLAGLGGSVGAEVARVDVDADIGLYQFQPLDGAAATVWETRWRGAIPLSTAERRVPSVGVEVAAGSSRQLNPWIRGGVSIRAGLGAP